MVLFKSRKPKQLSNDTKTSTSISALSTLSTSTITLSRKRDGIVFGMGILVGMIVVQLFVGFSNNTTTDFKSQQQQQQVSSSSSLLDNCPPTTTATSSTRSLVNNNFDSSEHLQSSSASSLQQQQQSSSSPVLNLDLLPPGFHPIYAYYGKFHHLTDEIPEKWWLQTSPNPNHHYNNNNDSNNNEWFSQHGQDVAIAKFFNFKRQGYFIDLASNDAVWASNTFSLEQNFDWKGICIEPNPVYWYRLSFRNCQVVGSIVGGETNVEVEVVLGDNPKTAGPFGGIVGSNFDNQKTNRNAAAIQKRYTVSLLTILQMFNAPKMIDYLSLDVEGAESYIMTGFPFDQYTFLTLTIERPKDELKQLLERHGYKHVLDFHRGDTLWAHESVYEEGSKRTLTNRQEIQQHQLQLTTVIPGYSE